MLKLKLMLTMSWKFTPCKIVTCHHHYNLASFDLIEDKMEKVPRGGNGLSARLGLAAAGEVGCAAVRAVVEHLSGQVA